MVVAKLPVDAERKRLREAASAWYRAEVAKGTIKQKCFNCGKTKGIAQFYPGERPGQIRRTCRSCETRRKKPAIPPNLSPAAKAEALEDLRWCECGRPKGERHESCDRCTLLDGSHPPNTRRGLITEADIIAVLRMLGGAASAEAVREALGATDRKSSKDQAFHRAQARMLKSGRLRQLRYETDPRADVIHSETPILVLTEGSRR